MSLLEGYAVGNGGRAAMVGAKPWNKFFGPMSHEVGDSTFYCNQDGEYETQVQIGSKLLFQNILYDRIVKLTINCKINTWYAIKRKEQFRYFKSRVSPIKDGHRHCL